MKKEQRAASEVLEKVVQDHSADDISFFEIKIALHERGFGLLMLLFTLPLGIPILPPGVATVAGVPLIIFALQMMYGADSPWLPKWVGNKTISRATLATIIEEAAPYLKKVEKLLRPRLLFVSSKNGEKIIGFVSFLCSISIIIPFPLTNFIPAIGILIMSFGLLSRDGLTIIFGIATSIFGLLVATVALFLGKTAVMAVFYELISIGN